MTESKFPNKISQRIGRAFAIMYNRTSMYKIDHQFTEQSIQEVLKTVTEGLHLISPVTIILNREQFFIEEEPFDLQLNTIRMAAHFKKTGIQSISFEKGIAEKDLKSFNVKLEEEIQNRTRELELVNLRLQQNLETIEQQLARCV